MNRLIYKAGVFLCAIVGIFIAISIFTYFYYSPILSSEENVMNYNDKGIHLLDDQGKEFFSFFGAKNYQYIPLSEINDSTKKLTIASEDQEFYHHPGFSVRGIGRSLILNIKNHTLSYGGSTITQQLVKNTLLNPNRNIVRKFQEIVLATKLEHYYNKDQILEMYLNTSYFGQNAFGIQNAAKIYFGKDASSLSMAESAYLVGLLPSPTNFSENKELALMREQEVLNRAKDEGFITNADYTAAKAKKLNLISYSSDLNVLAPHFALYVRDRLIEKFGQDVVMNSGLRVTTTLNRNWQELAEASVQKQINYLLQNGGSNGAVVAIKPQTGEIKAMVGSSSWFDETHGKINMAITPRQTGSAFKPIVYGLALEEQRITPTTILSDRPTTFKIPDCFVDCEYKPKDYDGNYRGNVTARRALANSLNIPSVQVMQKVGVPDVLKKAEETGITTLGNDSSKYGLSLVLGTGEVSLLELTNAYASFANQGKYVEANYITDIRDKKGDRIPFKENKTKYPWSPQIAFLISNILSDNKTRSEVFGNSLTISRPAAVKTGTTENYRGAWTVGYTPDVVIGVWAGNNDNQPMNNIAGSLGAAPIWKELMEEYNRGLAVKTFDPPEGIVRSTTCLQSADATLSALITNEYFLEGTAPVRNCLPTPNKLIPNIAVATPSADFLSSEEKSKEGRRGVGGAPPKSSKD